MKKQNILSIVLAIVAVAAIVFCIVGNGQKADLQKQVEGQMTAFFKGEMIRGRTFYACPPLGMDQELRLSYHLRLQAPDPSLLQLREGKIGALARACRARAQGRTPAPVRPGPLPGTLPAAGRAFALFRAVPAQQAIGANERALAALLALPLEAELLHDSQQDCKASGGARGGQVQAA